LNTDVSFGRPAPFSPKFAIDAVVLTRSAHQGTVKEAWMSVTGELASNIVASRWDTIPDDVRHEGTRALLNIVGCALGGADHPSMDITMAALGPFSGPATACVLGRSERFDPLLASILNGFSTHIHDYDDTLPKNYIHATSPVASALFAYASATKVTGPDFLHAFILGFEVISRIGNATFPEYYKAGWHSTGSLGVFGAAAAIGKLLALNAEQMGWAIGISATQSAGIRDMFGSMAKGLHPGRAAQSGYMAALLAQQGLTSGLAPLEGERGLIPITVDFYDLKKITENWGVSYELRDNTYKPYPSGIVIHPTIDACTQLREKHQLTPDQIATVELRMAPLVKDLCNKKHIRTGIESKFSIYHAAAIGLGRGKGGLAEFTDEAVNDPALKRLREITSAIDDPGVGDDSVVVNVRLADGRTIGMTLEGALGNLARPLSDAQLETKFRDQAGAHSRAQVDAAIAACWDVGELGDMSSVIEHCIPLEGSRAHRTNDKLQASSKRA
jgi:2-methylcitrate dehydratase PrpD